MDILGLHQPGILVTNHFGAEIWGWQNKDRYRRAILAHHLLEMSITDPRELETFVRLGIGSRLSPAEKSAIALALHRGHTLAIEYNNALARALGEAGIDSQSLIVCHPREIIADLVRSNDLDEETAQKMRQAWPEEGRGPDKVLDLPKIYS
ncbi:MAG TPA: hypothetical protein VIJ79_15420 [Acidobacteriaceae bacterium]